MSWQFRNPKTGEEFQLEENFDPQSQTDVNREGAIAKGYIPVIDIVNPKNGETHVIDDRELAGAIKKGYQTAENYHNEKNVLANRAERHKDTPAMRDMLASSAEMFPFYGKAVEQDIKNKTENNPGLGEDLLKLRNADIKAREERSPIADLAGKGVGLLQTPNKIRGLGPLTNALVKIGILSADAASKGEDKQDAAGKAATTALTVGALESVPVLGKLAGSGGGLVKKLTPDEFKEVGSWVSKIKDIPGIKHVLNYKGLALMKLLELDPGLIKNEAENVLENGAKEPSKILSLTGGGIENAAARTANKVRDQNKIKIPNTSPGFNLPKERNP